MIDRSATKNEIRDHLIALAAEQGIALSRSRADKYANKYKKGHLDSIPRGPLGGFDPTGRTATA